MTKKHSRKYLAHKAHYEKKHYEKKHCPQAIKRINYTLNQTNTPTDDATSTTIEATVIEIPTAHIYTVPHYKKNQILSLLVAIPLIISIIAIGVGFKRWSSVANTTLMTGIAPVQEPLYVAPLRWKLQWSLPIFSPPLAVNGVIITSDKHSVTAHDPRSGKMIWKYSRKPLLCQVIAHQDSIITVYRDRRGCGDVTKIDPNTGIRIATRSEFSDKDTRLLPFNDYLLFFSSQFTQIWTSELIKTVEYGNLVAPSQPGGQPRSGCTLLHGAIGDSATSLIEHCPHEEYARLTVIANSALEDHDHDPDQIISRALPLLDDGTRITIISSSKEYTLIARPRVDNSTVDIIRLDNSHDGTHNEVIASYPNYGNHKIFMQHSFEITSLWIAGTAILINTDTAKIISTMPHTRGPGVFLADSWYLPVEHGVIAINPITGKLQHSYVLEHMPPTHPIALETDNRNLIVSEINDNDYADYADYANNADNTKNDSGDHRIFVYAPIIPNRKSSAHFSDS